jgi:hypothetical protein
LSHADKTATAADAMKKTALRKSAPMRSPP